MRVCRKRRIQLWRGGGGADAAKFGYDSSRGGGGCCGRRPGPHRERAALSDFRRLFAEFVEAGYEGIMLRNAAGVYRANYRSNDLQKYKEFMEDEYRIIDFKEGEGRDAGAVIWVCETADGKEFTVRPRGSFEQRREWFNDGDSYIGKNLTVVYQELTEDGKPRFPVAKAVRYGY